MTERHPLSDALAAAEHSAEAQGYEVPVELIRSRSRRRRRARTGTAAGALALVVAGAALVVPNLPSPTPAPATVQRPAPGLCGLTYDELAADDGGPDPVPIQAPVPQGLELAGVSQIAHGTFVATTTFGAKTFELQAGASTKAGGNTSAGLPEGDPAAWAYGTTLALLQDGVVVAAQPGDVAPALDAIPEINGDRAALPLPLVTSVETSVVSCAHEQPLPGGQYEAVVTQTSGWLYTESEGTWASRVTSEPVPVQVDGPAPADPTPAPTVPAVCGLRVDDLASDDGIEPVEGEDHTSRNLWFVRVLLPQPRIAPSDGLIPGGELEMSATAAWRVPVTTTVGAPAVDFVWTPTGVSLGATVVLVRDGAVVAVLDNDDPAMPLDKAARTRIDEVAQEIPLVDDLRAPFLSCATGERAVLDPGQYDLLATTTVAWRVIDPAENDRTTYRWVARTTSEPISVTLPSDGPSPDPLVCGAPDDGLRALADTGPLRVRTDSAPARHARGGNASFTVDVTNQSDERVRATTGHPEVVVTRDGVVVGGLGATEDIGSDVDLDAGESQTFDASSLVTACAGAHPGGSLPAGEYELWAVLTFTPQTGDTRDPGATWQTAGGPWPVTVVGDDEFPPTHAWSGLKCGDTTGLLTDRAASTAQGDVTLEVTQWANPDRDGRLAQVDAAIALTNSGDEPIEVNYVGLVATRRGSVVSQGLVYAAVRPELWVTIAPGETMTLPRPSEYGDIFGCDRDGLPSDELDVWVQVKTDAGAFVAGPHTLEAAA
ncbi:hypothetical protein [Cellulomonas sp.]|uniref:hypothetical protein n=1 Tax=Cellulomonas sp. TaxID=40001 RepID=UPI0025884346|nr:hypothetical protein [Cellulomonas sp.]MCR6689139.1 hypothetical protein [Cellulomonas sp.]